MCCIGSLTDQVCEGVIGKNCLTGFVMVNSSIVTFTHTVNVCIDSQDLRLPLPGCPDMRCSVMLGKGCPGIVLVMECPGIECPD